MNKKKTKRILLGLILLAFCLLTIIPITTYAVGENDNNKDNGSEKKEPKDESVTKVKCKEIMDEYYKISAEVVSTKEGVVTGFLVKSYKSSDSVNEPDLSFKITKVTNKDIDDITFSPGTMIKPKEIPISDPDGIANNRDGYFKNVTDADDGNQWRAEIEIQVIPGANKTCETGAVFTVKT